MILKKLLVYSPWILAPLGALALTGCSKKSDSQPTSSHTEHAKLQSETPNNSASVQKKGDVWTCPMHPQIKKDGPGTCPICGMSLVKAGEVEVDQTDAGAANMPDGHAPFKLSSPRQQMIGVRYGVVEKKPLFKSIEAAGRVAFDPELYTAQSEYIEALKQRERVKESPIADVKHSAERMVESAKLRLKVLGLSDQQINNLTASGSAGSSLLVPKPGETLWIYAEVYEMDLSHIKPGLEAKISGGSLGGREIIGRVVSVDRVINPAARTAKVRILVPNARSMLRPEAYVDVSIRSPLGEQVVVPFDAVLDAGKQAWVFVAKDGGTFEPRLITIRFRADDEIAIETGVMAGEKIVTSANFLVDSESRLKGVLVSQTAEAPTPSQAVDAAKTAGTEKEAPAESPQGKTPECPKGQVWHAEMKHCMTKVGQ